MQFGRAFPCILQAIWEADSAKGPVRVSKLDVTDSYHHGTLRLCQVGAFTSIVPLALDDDCIIISIDLVLPIGWVDSPKFFCIFLETLTDVVNALVDTELPVLAYGDISTIPSTGPPPPPTHDSLTHIDCYMDYIISVVQGGPERQHRFFDGKIFAIKWIFPLLLGESQESESVNKLLEGEGECTRVKEILG